MSPAHIRRGRHHRPASRSRRLLWWTATIGGAGTLFVAAAAASNWIAGLNSGSSGEGQAATITNLSIAAASSPAAGNLLYPGGNGDVVLTITNPNPFPVTITAVNLPTSSTYATGYTDAGLTSLAAGCDATTSTVAWAFSSAVSGTSHALTSALVVAASGSLTAKFTNDAVMGGSAPAACAGAYFKMPSLTGISATGGAATPTSGTPTDAWTS